MIEVEGGMIISRERRIIGRIFSQVVPIAPVSGQAVALAKTMPNEKYFFMTTSLLRSVDYE